MACCISTCTAATPSRTGGGSSSAISGLATCEAFDLSVDERTFFERHRNYDRCYLPGHLIHWFDAAKGPLVLSQDGAALLDSYRPVAAVMGKFFHRKNSRNKTKLTPYPAERRWKRRCRSAASPRANLSG